MGCIVDWDAETLAAVGKMKMAEGGCIVNWMASPPVKSLNAADGCVVNWDKHIPVTAHSADGGCVVKWKDAKAEIKKVTPATGCFINWMVSPEEVAKKMAAAPDDFCLFNF